MKVLKSVYCCVILICCLGVKSQDGKYRRMYHEGTWEVKLPYDTANKVTSLNVFSVLVEYRLYTKPEAMNNLHDSGFVSRTADIDSNYRSYPKNAKIIKEYFDYKLSKKINDFMKMQRPRVSIEDSAFFVRELKRIKQLFKASKVTSYTMSDSLYFVLKKYPADNEILIDILYYQFNISAPHSFNRWALVKFYAFDLRNKKLVYYNYKMQCGGWRYDLFTNWDVPTKRIPGLIRGYKNYIKQNKNTLKRPGRQWVD